MNVQKSFTERGEADFGILYLVGTPIGNLGDMTYRAVQLLQEVDWVAAEDTRQTRKLLSHYDIHVRLMSYHEHNKQASGADVLNKLVQGESIALVSDAGLPAISDPGYELVKQAIALGISVVPIPGANAALSALIVSGLATTRFLFIGFLPKETKHRLTTLQQLEHEQASLLFYESPHRVGRTLEAMLSVWGDRRVVLARELTKKFEEVARGTLSEGLIFLREQPAKGEYCIVVEGKQMLTKTEIKEALWWSLLTLEEHMDYYAKEGYDRKEAMKKVAADRNVARRDVYNKLATAD